MFGAVQQRNALVFLDSKLHFVLFKVNINIRELAGHIVKYIFLYICENIFVSF